MPKLLAEVFPPGEFLQDELDARQWTQAEFAQIIDRPAQLVSEIISGTRDISRQTAAEFGAAFGQSPQYWLNLQSSYIVPRSPCFPCMTTAPLSLSWLSA